MQQKIVFDSEKHSPSSSIKNKEHRSKEEFVIERMSDRSNNNDFCT